MKHKNNKLWDGKTEKVWKDVGRLERQGKCKKTENRRESEMKKHLFLKGTMVLGKKSSLKINISINRHWTKGSIHTMMSKNSPWTKMSTCRPWSLQIDIGSWCLHVHHDVNKEPMDHGVYTWTIKSINRHHDVYTV